MISVLVIGKGDSEGRMDLCLASRAFGASSITFAGKRDKKLQPYFSKLNGKWGGEFSISFVSDWKEFIKTKRNYKTVYLTRFGTPINKAKYSLMTYKNILLIVTLTEAYKNLYKMTDFNVSITAQPHCSTAAVAVFLHTFYEGRELAMHFENAKYKVVPEEKRVHMEKT